MLRFDIPIFVFMKFTVRARFYIILYVYLIKYRRNVLIDIMFQTFRDICLQIEERYEINFIEIGLDGNRVHFLIQSVPMNSPKK